MVHYPFSVGDGGERASYAVGQPMGAYSSWSAFAVAHHALMFHCCQVVGRDWRKAQYVILGDDVLIGDRDLGEEYRRAVSGLGVEVSPAKTFTSVTLAEFAKRYLFQGEEVTPFPVSAVSDNLGDVSLLVGALGNEGKKGLEPKSGIPGSIGALFRRLHHTHRHCRRMEQQAQEALLMTQFQQGSVSARDLVLGLSPPLDEAGYDVVEGSLPDIISASVASVVTGSLGLGEMSFPLR